MQNNAPLELIAREFDCYYQADELVWDDVSLGMLAKHSADRLYFYGEHMIGDVIDSLVALQSARDGDFVERLEISTRVEWSSDQNWTRFKNQLEMIVEYLRTSL